MARRSLERHGQTRRGYLFELDAQVLLEGMRDPKRGSRPSSTASRSRTASASRRSPSTARCAASPRSVWSTAGGRTRTSPPRGPAPSSPVRAEPAREGCAAVRAAGCPRAGAPTPGRLEQRHAAPSDAEPPSRCTTAASSSTGSADAVSCAWRRSSPSGSRSSAPSARSRVGRPVAVAHHVPGRRLALGEERVVEPRRGAEIVAVDRR